VSELRNDDEGNSQLIRYFADGDSSHSPPFQAGHAGSIPVTRSHVFRRKRSSICRPSISAPSGFDSPSLSGESRRDSSYCPRWWVSCRHAPLETSHQTVVTPGVGSGTSQPSTSPQYGHEPSCTAGEDATVSSGSVRPPLSSDTMRSATIPRTNATAIPISANIMFNGITTAFLRCSKRPT
jgi:hypothetical protein